MTLNDVVKALPRCFTATFKKRVGDAGTPADKPGETPLDPESQAPAVTLFYKQGAQR